MAEGGGGTPVNGDEVKSPRLLLLPSRFNPGGGEGGSGGGVSPSWEAALILATPFLLPGSFGSVEMVSVFFGIISVFIELVNGSENTLGGLTMNTVEK